MPPMPHFLFGVRNILNGGGVVDGCEWHSLLYIRCVFGWGWGGRLPTERCAESNGCAFLPSFYSQTELDMESYKCYVSKLITTFSLSQMNNVELVRILSWRENAPFEEREKNKFPKAIIFDYKQGIWLSLGYKKVLEISRLQRPTQFINQKMWCHQESNRGHKDFQSFALPTELWHQLRNCECKGSDNLCNWQTFSAFSLIFSLHLHVIQIFAVPLHRI